MKSLFLTVCCCAWTTAAAALTITSDTEWCGALSMRESVRVEVGATLTVVSGAVITFHGGKLEVAGRLVAENAHFTGSNWDGIVLKGCDAGTVLSGGRVDGAKTGIFAGGGTPRLLGVTVSGNDVGIELKQQSAAQISDCVIVGNRKVGLFIKDESTPTVTGNRIEKNGKYGAYVYRALPRSFSGNRFSDNETGLMIANAGSDPRIEGNRFAGNQIGILVDRAARPQLRGNFLSNNRTGVRLYRRADARIEGNAFRGNDDALSLAYSSYPLVHGNDFSGNKRAFFLEFQSSAWEKARGETTREAEAGNRGAFGQSSGHAEEAGERRKPEGLTGLVDARDNWWGEEGTAELVRIGSAGNPSFIVDGRDTATFVEGGQSWSLDRVNFAPWRNAPIGFQELP
ncbi:MAG: hypothetical protein A2005_11315 [Desulfuromonadales bacterium GWC2_61_20]|nr:MAG: hypothetical protein A2005_11315 [Desulfuromonadales bacterium GWC2_61_20]HAD05087.1 hypothetical protein [Desulfuromonas sp.]